MRRINFRARSTSIGGAWVYGYVIFKKDGDAYIWKKGDGIRDIYISVHPETVGQFTGLYDENGLSIYEGDILDKEEDLVNRVVSGVSEVYFGSRQHRDGSSLGWIAGYSSLLTIFDHCKVIGNIHQHPELLKEPSPQELTPSPRNGDEAKPAATDPGGRL